MTPRGAERPDDDADLRDEQGGRSRRRFGRGRPDSTDFGDVPEEETGWLDDLRTAKQARGAIGPGGEEPEPGHGRRSIDRGNPAPSSGAPMRPSSGAPARPSSGAPARPSSGAPRGPSSGVPGRPTPGVPGRPPTAPQPRGRHTSDEFPTMGRHGPGDEPVSGRRRAAEDAPTGRRAVPDDVPTGRRAAPDDVPTGRRAAPEDAPTGRRAAPEDAPTGRRAAPDAPPTGRRAATDGAATGRHGTGENPAPGRRRASEETPTDRRSATGAVPTGRRSAPDDTTTGRRAAPDETPTGRRFAPDEASTGLRGAPEDAPTGRRAARDDVAAGRRAARDDADASRHGGDTSTGRHGTVGAPAGGAAATGSPAVVDPALESTGRHGQVNGEASPTRSRRSRAADTVDDARTVDDVRNVSDARTGEPGRRSADRPDREPAGGSGRPVSPVPGIGGTGFGSRNINPGRARPDGEPSQRPPSPGGAAGQARPDGSWKIDTGRHGAPEPGPRPATPGGPGRATVPPRNSPAGHGTGAIPPVVPGPAGVRSPAVPGRAGAMADSPSGVVRRPDSHDGHTGHTPSGVEHPADAAASVIHPGAALGSVSPEPVRQGPRSPHDMDRPGPGSGPATGRVTATASARVGAPPAGRVSGAASVAGIAAAPRPHGVDAPQSPAVGIPPVRPGDGPARSGDGPARSGDGPARPGDGPVRPATGAARVTAAASVPVGAASVPGTASVLGTGSIPGTASVLGTGSIPGTASVHGTGPIPGAAAVVPARAEAADAVDGERPGLRQQMRTQRRARVVALLTLAGVVLLVLPVIFGVMSVVRDPVFRSLDTLSVPSWAAQQVDDRGSGSRWCFMDCRFRERTAQSQQPFAQTNQAYAAALRKAGWQPWKVSGCPDQPIAASDGVYTCWRRDEFTLDLWVRLPECAVDKIAQQDPALLPSNPANGAPPKPGKCTGSTVSIKVQNAITDQRGTPDGENPGLTGETPDPVLSNDPLLEPSTSPS